MGGMRYLSQRHSYDILHFLNGYDWKGLGKGSVVDVGGNFGQCSDAIASEALELSFVVQNLTNVFEHARTERVEH